ncbi:hypothetical protein K432DRAFT_152161 [Lepidopterella palustris CBS 459.81]|uniref:Uncharacterized protein n=1 Tax=Lepidopterella palustris CBS 459.81 TaxID=1314670 RepID=A0A8E2JB86_9PEZI|nr:hypothetical protein K432DRAFT_152161 [Lepidopterella palustris CBS 459.81]
MSLKLRAKAAEAQNYSGHNLLQWRRFYYITKDEANKLILLYPVTWMAVPADEQERVLETVNMRCHAEEIPRIDVSLLNWRMSQLMRDVRRIYNRSSPGSLPQVEAEATLSSAPHQAQDRAEAAYSYGTVREAAYDPVREAAGVNKT